MAVIIRAGRADHAAFTVHTDLMLQRCQRPRGWLDFALAQGEPLVLDFLATDGVARYQCGGSGSDATAHSHKGEKRWT